MKYLKNTLILFFLSFFVIACELEDLLGDGAVDGDTFAPVHEEKFEVASSEIDIAAEVAAENAEISFKKLGLKMEKIADQLESFDEGSSSESLKISGFKLEPGLQKLLDKSTQNSAALGKLGKSGLLGKFANRTSMDGEIEELFSDVLILDESSRDGNTIPYKINKDICDGESECEVALHETRVVQKLNSESAGTIELHYQTFVLMIIGYSDDEWYFEISLDAIKSAIDDIATSASGVKADDLPQVMQGAVRYTIALQGDEDVKMSSGIIRDIKIEFKQDADHGGEEMKIAVKESKLVELTTDFANDRLTIDFDLGIVSMVGKYAQYSDSVDEHAEHVHKPGSRAATLVDVSFGFDGFRGKIVVDAADKVVTGTDVGLKSDMVAKEGGVEIFTLHAPKSSFEFSVPADDVSYDLEFEATSAIDISLEGTEDFDIDGDPFRFAISMSSGTKMINYAGDDYYYDDTPDITKVTEGGPLVLEFSGADPSIVTIDAGECFTDSEDSDGNDTVVIVGCPSS